ncbi:MAG: HD domain-containing protein [Fibrobacter sp.]|nr:HD domain-containing protein [Fibrobacter sp.]
MIRETDLLYFQNWFEMYVRQFCTGIEKIDSALCLKVKHTKNVVIEILDIANALNLDAEQCYCAQIVAIFHDIGRFEQYIRYGTYSDQKSEDHATIGLNVITRTGVLGRLAHYEQELIKNVVTHHNRASLPRTDDQNFLFFLKLLRDADKIDILRVVTEHYAGYNSNDAINIGLPDSPEISATIADCIMNGRLADVNDMRTLNDFKLLQVGWVYDINFPRTYQIFKQRKYLETLSDVLPQTGTVIQTIASAQRFLSKKVSEEINVHE